MGLEESRASSSVMYDRGSGSESEVWDRTRVVNDNEAEAVELDRRACAKPQNQGASVTAKKRRNTD